MAKFLLETSLPYIDVGLLIIKDDTILGQPDDPITGYEDLTEYLTPKGFPGF